MSWIIGLIIFLIVSGLVGSGAKQTGGAGFVLFIAIVIIIKIMVSN